MNEIDEKAGYCLSCISPRCETGCPTGNHIRDMIKAMKDGNPGLAADILHSANPFPELTSSLCDCDRQCQGHCVRGIRGMPVQIQAIERYLAARYAAPYEAPASSGHSVAIIGAGPSALSAAYFLRLSGCDVSVYEKESRIGGAVYTGIPSWRFDKSALERIQENLQRMGVRFIFGCRVGESIPLQQLREGSDRVLAAVGAQSENSHGLTAERGCRPGLSMLHDLNILGRQEAYRHQYHHAVVWGGGNVAMDCARSLIRIMADVTVVYRRSEKEMPASRKEIEAAKAEGVQFRFLENIRDLVRDGGGNVTGAVCVRMELGSMDESGRAVAHEIAGSEHVLACDLVVPAIGQAVDLSALGLQPGQEAHGSSIGGVYICGDAHLGPKTVGAAIQDGRKAAMEIMESFRKEQSERDIG